MIVVLWEILPQAQPKLLVIFVFMCLYTNSSSHHEKRKAHLCILKGKLLHLKAAI
jgi:hypothetical protein